MQVSPVSRAAFISCLILPPSASVYSARMSKALHECTQYGVWPLASLLVLFVVPKTARSLAETQQFAGPQPMPNPTPKPHELSTSVIMPLEYKTSPYSGLTSELQAHAHSRINVNLRPGFDFMDIMLKLLQWNEQDVSQMWVRPAAHVDQASYDVHTPLGLETAIQDLLRKVWGVRMAYAVAMDGSSTYLANDWPGLIALIGYKGKVA